MASYSLEIRQPVLKKLMPPSNLSVMQISRDTGIPAPTLYSWKNKFQSQGFVVPAKPTTTTLWDARAKLAALIQTDSMNEAERKDLLMAWIMGEGKMHWGTNTGATGGKAYQPTPYRMMMGGATNTAV